MKKKLLLFLGAILLILGFAKLSSVNADAATIKATDWGAKKVFTTPKKTRGVWYYKEGKKVRNSRLQRILLMVLSYTRN
ncbi:hypothetical protein AAULH_09288 [Lactobacillus helveticus MTCC 5463]|nr:hypothetical protein AAULH_09288 [Lactobacillus helveticus MTCC 5463]